MQGFMRVCEGFIFKWQKAHYDEVVRNGKRKVWQAGEYYEGCGKQRHKRESCQLTSHPNYNENGLWIHSEGYRIKKAWLEANGKPDDHPELRWYEYAGDRVIRGAQNPGEKSCGGAATTLATGQAECTGCQWQQASDAQGRVRGS